MKHLLTEHPATVGESYLEHLHSAWSFAGSMLLGTLACLIHGLLPFLFTQTGSSLVKDLHDRMIINRSRRLKIGTGDNFPPVDAPADSHRA